MGKFEDYSVRYVTDLIRDFKLEDFQAAGWPGNFGVETGGFEHVQEINPVGGGRGGLGDAQWTGPRRLDFEAWLARHPLWTARDYDANYSMLFRELEGPERAALEAVRQARDVDEATEIVMRRFERPGVEHLERRKEYGRQALTAFRATGLNVATLKAMPRPGGTAAIEPTQEIVTRLPSQFDWQSLAPVVLAVLTALQQGRQGGTQPGSQSGQSDILSLLLPLLTGGQPLPLPPPVVVTPPAPVVTTPPVAPATPKTSVGLGLLGLFGSLLGMTTGAVGTPFGMGEVPTTAGTLSVLIPGAIAAIGSTGIFGPFGAILGRIVSGAMSAARTPQ